MPYIDTPKLEDIKKAADRKKLQRLLAEKAAGNYSYSHSALHKLLSQYEPDPELVDYYLGKCVLACTEDDKRTVMNGLNDEISTIMAELDLKSVRSVDPYGRKIDCIIFDSASSSLSKTKLIELAPRFGLSTDDACKLVDLATTKTPYTSVQIRSVKEKAVNE